MGISRRAVLQRIGAVAATAAAGPSLAGTSASAASNGAIRLDGNENAYGPSPQAISAIEKAARTTASRYPHAEAGALRAAIAAFHAVSPDRIVLGCGSSEIVRMAAHAFLGPGKTLVAARPTFEFVSDCAHRVGAEVVSCPLTHEYAHDAAALLALAGPSTRLVYVCNPNNPTGTLTSRRDLETLVHGLPATAMVLIDEAYHHYAGNAPDYASFIDNPIADDRVIVMRTFSTVFGLAGLRVGYAVASPQTTKRLAAWQLPESVNALAATAALAALADREHVRLSVARNTDDRQEFFNQCHARMLRAIDSRANFVMLNADVTAVQIVEHFKAHSVALAPPIPAFDTHIRVSLGTPAEMREFWRVWDLMGRRHMSM